VLRQSRARHLEEYSWTGRTGGEVRSYVIVVEEANDSYSAYAPDLPGRAATGSSAEDACAKMREAVALHLEGLREANLPVPEPLTTTYTVDLA
jgi:predicted RNase H-like HicB family nuclease